MKVPKKEIVTQEKIPLDDSILPVIKEQNILKPQQLQQPQQNIYLKKYLEISSSVKIQSVYRK